MNKYRNCRCRNCRWGRCVSRSRCGFRLPAWRSGAGAGAARTAGGGRERAGVRADARADAREREDDRDPGGDPVRAETDWQPNRINAIQFNQVD